MDVGDVGDDKYFRRDLLVLLLLLLRRLELGRVRTPTQGSGRQTEIRAPLRTEERLKDGRKSESTSDVSGSIRTLREFQRPFP